jgi:hypothetical protein
VAVSAYAGAIGLIGGGLSFGPLIDERLPLGSLLLAGLALLAFVAAPMSVAAVSAIRPGRHTPALVLGAGELLIAWIAVELVFIQAYSWLQPLCLIGAGTIVAMAWRLDNDPRDTAQRSGPAHATATSTSSAPDVLGRL